MPGWSDLHSIDDVSDIALMEFWMSACKACGVLNTRKKQARAYWVGMGSRPDVMRTGLIAYRDAITDAQREEALLRIVDQYDADVAAETRK